MTDSNLVERVELLESKLAFQDDTIEQLNQTIISLNREILSLKGEFVSLAEKLVQQADNTSDSSQVEVPPHY